MSRYDIPEPEWWEEARRLRAKGYNTTQICIRVEKCEDSVRHAIRRGEGWARKQSTYAPGNRVRKLQDYKRDHARREARDRWRKEGKSRPLKEYYTQLECL